MLRTDMYEPTTRAVAIPQSAAVAPQPVLQASPRTQMTWTETELAMRYRPRQPRGLPEAEALATARRGQRLGAASSSRADLDWLRAGLPAADLGETLRL